MMGFLFVCSHYLLGGLRLGILEKPGLEHQPYNTHFDHARLPIFETSLSVVAV